MHVLTTFWRNCALRLSDVPASYNIIAVSSADVDASKPAGVTFTFDSGLSSQLPGYTDAQFEADIKTLQGSGQQVIRRAERHDQRRRLGVFGGRGDRLPHRTLAFAAPVRYSVRSSFRVRRSYSETRPGQLVDTRPSSCRYQLAHLVHTLLASLCCTSLS
jgi:hypothetical protein